MSLIDLLSRPDCWEQFYEYKTSLMSSGAEVKALRAFIDRRGYLPVCEAIEQGDRFPLPRKAVLSKQGSRKRRTVYIYPPAESAVLKLLCWLMLRRYDSLFSAGLWSFRPGRTAQGAIRTLTAVPDLKTLWSYQADISDYFNSVPVPLLLPLLEEVTGEDPRLCTFLRRLLAEPEVLDHGVPVTEQKGIMAGTPLSAFYANLFLRELDAHFTALGIPYARYSDDILLLTSDREEAETHAAFLRNFLAERGLAINPAKERLAGPEEGWTFLGFQWRAGEIDIAPATVKKLKQKMRRKTRALCRWRDRKGRTGEQAAAAFLRIFNRKLLESPATSDLSWSRWFFPTINTDKSLRVIDRYAQDCVRVLVSGRRTKGRYRVRYEDLKRLGYRSLVHAYYEKKD